MISGAPLFCRALSVNRPRFLRGISDISWLRLGRLQHPRGLRRSALDAPFPGLQSRMVPSENGSPPLSPYPAFLKPVFAPLSAEPPFKANSAAPLA